MDPPWQCAYTEQINLPQLLYLWLPLICICAVVVCSQATTGSGSRGLHVDHG